MEDLEMETTVHLLVESEPSRDFVSKETSKKEVLGVISAIGSLILITVIAVNAGVFGSVTQDLWMLVTGQVKFIVPNNTTFLMMFPVILAVVAIELMTIVIVGGTTTAILGKSKNHSVGDMLRKMTHDHHFLKFFLIVGIEEVFARWLFLGLLTQIPFLSGAVAFYVLFLLGNALWAFVHIFNFENKQDRNILRVLPQFVAGIFFTYVFVKYGLLASILAHFASNAILFSVHKVQQVDWVDFFQTAYAGLVVLVSYSLMTKPVSDIQQWFGHSPQFVLEGWGFWDYVLLAMVVGWGTTLLFDVLLYDQTDLEKNKKESEIGAVPLIVGLAIATAILFGLFWLMGLLVSDVPYRILCLAIVFMFFQKGSSGSALGRVFWSGIPTLFVSMCVLQALGFWLAFAYILFGSVIAWPRLKLKDLDD